MNPFREAWGWIKVGLLTVAGRTVRTEDYEIAYNHVASTYDDWNARMAVHTLKVLPEVWLEEIRAHPEEKVRVLDFACGNGIVTRALLERLEGCPNLEIVGVDLSPGMIEVCRKTITDPRAAFVHAEGLSYLRAKKAGQFHAVFCGWGLVYFSKAPVLAEFARVLVPGGLVGAIMNVRGTLSGVEEAYLKTMVENPRQMRKVMTIRFSLPWSARTYHRWFRAQGFQTIGAGEGGETVVRATVGDLLDWLTQTGALAGCDQLFHNLEAVRPRLLVHLGGKTAQDGTWQVTHRFVFGHYTKKRKTP